MPGKGRNEHPRDTGCVTAGLHSCLGCEAPLDAKGNCPSRENPQNGGWPTDPRFQRSQDYRLFGKERKHG